MIARLSIVCYASLIPLHAEIGALDWESSVSVCQQVHTYDGLEFTNARGTICTQQSPTVSNGTRSSNDVSGFVAKHVVNIPFTPVAIDLAEFYSQDTFKTPTPLTFTGIKDGADPVSVTFTIDGLLDGAGGIEDFQTFHFPSTFANITELRGPSAAFSCDNFIFDTVVPPPFPDEFLSEPQAFTSFEVIHTRGVHDNHFVVGPDFSYHTGFRQGNSLHVLGENPSVTSGIGHVFHDPNTRGVFYRSGSSLFRQSPAGTAELATLQEVNDAGISASSLGKPVPYGEDLLFLAYDLTGGDTFHLLRKSSSSISTIVGPDTVLPLPGGSTGTPYHFPNFLVASGDSFAFDTSVSGSSQQDRVYASFATGQPVRVILSEGYHIDIGSEILEVESFLKLSFAADRTLEIMAQTNRGSYLLRYDISDNVVLLSVEQIDGVIIAPENDGALRSGTTYPGIGGERILHATSSTSEGNTLYRERQGLWYRIIGAGDTLGGEKIAYLSYLATPSGAPDRVIVDVRFETSSSISRNIALHLSQPVSLPPASGDPK